MLLAVADNLAQDGRELPADVIVMANGFNITEMGFPMKVRAALAVHDCLLTPLADLRPQRA